jgi:hypothetical protein
VPTVRNALVDAGLGLPVLLGPHHLASDFDCGVDLLNEKIRKSLSEVARDGVEQQLTTYVVTCRDAIVGFYSTRPIIARPESGPGSLPLSFIARCGVDRRWRKPGVADNMLLHMLHQAWSGPETNRPQALVGLAVNQVAKRFFRKIGIRPLGNAIDPRGVIVPPADLADVQALGPLS